MAGINDYSNTAGSNTTINGIDIAEGCSPAGINNAIRQLMADIADVDDGVVPLQTPDINGGTIDGAAISGSSTIDNSIIGGTTPAAGTFTTLTANTSITGTLNTAAQPNITSVGTLTSATVSGDLTVDTNTLYVDSANNRVGIGTSSPSEKLEVNGITKSTSGLKVGSTETYIYEGASDTLNIRVGSDGPYVEFIDAGSSVLEFGNASNALALTSSGTERMRITDGGNVGIGTSSPSGILHLDMGTPDIVAELTANSPTFTYRNGTGAWFHAGKHPTNDYFYIGDGATTTTNIRMVIDSSGNVGIGTSSPSQALDVVGSIELSGSIYLGGTGSANALDDYEEGTWTPVFLGGTTNPTLTYSAQDGSYRKIGNFVYFDGKIQSGTVSNVGSGNLRVGGLPFTPDSGNDRGFAVHTVQNVDTNMGYVQIIEGAQTYWICRTNTNGVSQSEIQTSTLGNSEVIHFSGAYKTS